jgi:hypothetical protein
VVVDKAATAIEFNGGIAVVHLKVEGLRALFEGGRFGEVQELGAYSLAARGWFEEKLIDPSAFAAIFGAEVEADDEIGDCVFFLAREKDDAAVGIAQGFQQIFSHAGFVKGNGPRIVALHAAHDQEQRIEVGGGAALDGNGHERVSDLSK